MKIVKLSLILLLGIICISNVSAKDKDKYNKLKGDPIETISEYGAMYQSGDFYFGGQPNLAALKWIREEGVSLVINLRSQSEIDKFTKGAFNEEKMIGELKMKYISIPMKGKAGYSPENLEKFAEAMEKHKGKVFIHCASAGRVTNIMMAYLIKHKNFSVNEALQFGKKLKYYSPLELFLEKELSAELK